MIKNRSDKKPDLKLIKSPYPLNISIGPLEIVAAPKNMRPFRVGAMAFEEDTYLVLSADKKMRDPAKPFVRIMTDLIEFEPKTPGSVLVKGQGPFRLLAIVHDLDQEPTWREEWIELALKNIFEEAENRKFLSVAIPFLGTLYGKLEKDRFVEFLWKALKQFEPQYLKQIWVVVPKGIPNEVFKKFT